MDRSSIHAGARGLCLSLVLAVLPAAARGEITVAGSDYFVESWAAVDRDGNNALLEDEGDRKVTELSDVLGFSGNARSIDSPSRGNASHNVSVFATGTTASVLASGSCDGSTDQSGASKEAYGEAGFSVEFTLTAPARLSFQASMEASEGGRAGVNHPLAGLEVEDGSDSLSADAVLQPGTYFVSAVCGADAYFYRDSGGHRAANARFSLTLRLTEETTRCEGDELRWVGGSSGAFSDPQNWSPPQVPAVDEDGGCDTALVEGVRNATIDLSAALARAADPLAAPDPRGVEGVENGRLVVRRSRALRTINGPLNLDASDELIGGRSLEVGADSSLLLENEALVARHVAIGAGGDGEVEVADLGGYLETTGRLGLGADGAGRLVVRDAARALSAEAVLGELSEQGSALVQGAGSEWTTGNLAVGFADDASLIVDAGGLLRSDESWIDLGLADDERARVIVQGRDAAGTQSRWEADSLEVWTRGALEVDGGAVVEIAEELQLWGFGGTCATPVNCVLVRDGRVAAETIDLLGGELRVEPAGRVVARTKTFVGDHLRRRAEIVLRGPASEPQLETPLLEVGIEGHLGRVDLQPGAKAKVKSFAVGDEPDSDGYLALLSDGPPPRQALLVAEDDGSFSSYVGALSPAPATEHHEPTGVLELRFSRLELSGPAHSLFIQRLGLLESGDGEVSIQSPGQLLNQGVIRGGLTLEGDYEQATQGSYELGSILVVSGPLAQTLSPLAAAEFPRRALRAKPQPAPARPFVVTGDATLAGRLVLQFGNGMAPRAGDAFDVLDVGGNVTGEFGEVAIRGLVPGSYAFEPSLAGGKLALTSLTDAEALPTVSVKAKKKLKETAKGGKFKLKRTGDTSAPLLVSYTVGGTAQPRVDYEELPGVIEIPARKKSATIVVRPFPDGEIEGPETIELELAPNEAFAPGIVSSATIELTSKDK